MRAATRAAPALVTDAAPRSARPAPTALGRKPRVVRTRSRAVKPMSLDDALLALSDASQNFLVFRNADSDGVAILYRRPDGDFGLIEPEG